MAARGGTASGKESEFLAMKRAVEARAMSLRGEARVGIVPSAIVGGGDEGDEGTGSTVRIRKDGKSCHGSGFKRTDVREKTSALHSKLEQSICNLADLASIVVLLWFMERTYITG